MDRRQHRQSADYEVPVCVSHGSEGFGGSALCRLRGRRSNPRHRRENVPLRAGHHVNDCVEVDLQRRRLDHVSRQGACRPRSTRAKSFVRCDALILDEISGSETKPYMEVGERDAEIGHEATVSKVGDDQLFYLMSRGLTEGQATGMIVNGFIEPITRTLPMEYAVEWSRLIELQMEGAVG